MASVAWCQEASRVTPAPPSAAAEPGSKRIFWLIPNSRTYPTMKDFRPITAREKFKIATEDALDPGTFILAAVFAGKGQLTNVHPALGQGVAGYARRFGTSYADFAIADVMVDGVLPTALHQDPRYFRKGVGGTWSRLAHAAGQIFVTYQDSGRRAFNFSEMGGNAAAVAISQAYYTDDRTAGAAAGKLGTYIGLDIASNILKEFWPDLQRKLQRKPKP